MDGSAEARNILPFAEGLARTSMAQLTLLQVIPRQYPLTAPYTSHASHGFQGLDAETAAAGEALERIAAPLRERGFRVETETVWGAHPAEGILDFVESHEVDVVAMETHGRGGVTRLILGSVADKVIRGATVPILLHRSGAAGDGI
jgi:nucleotide-binding universal stress UspA family protein